MRTVEISHRTIIFTVVFLLGLWFLWEIKQIILLFFIAFLVATALKPLVEVLAKFKIPRALSILIVYVLLFGGFGAVLASIIPPLVDQTQSLVNQLPDYLAKLGIYGIDGRSLGQQIGAVGELPVNLLRLATSVLSNLINLFVVLVLSFYMQLERKSLERRIAFFFGENAPRVQETLNKIETRLGRWVRGEVLLMTIIAVLTYIGLRLLGIQHALPLALLAGFLEVVPNVGPLVSAVPATIVGFTVSPVMGISVIALYFLVQQLENSIIVPKIMQASVGLSPLVTLVALGIGAQIGGIMGAVLAIPMFVVIQVIVRDFFAEKLKL